MTNASDTADILVLSTESATTATVRGSSEVSAESVQSAVYTYIKAIRALGRTQINTAEIADASSLSTSEVNRAIAALRGQGIKLSNV